MTDILNVKVSDEHNLPKKYYRLLDLQGTGYMASGYNATSLKELADGYASYKSNDWSNDDEGSMSDVWQTLTLEQKLREIEDDEFEIEESGTPFDEANIH